MKGFTKILLAAFAGTAAVSVLNSCASGLPEGAEPVRNFQADQYMGTWFEIARYDFRFEKNLKNVTARYSNNPDGTVRVVNRGYDYKKNVWKESTGEARFVKDKNTAMLKVAFFKPVWAAYNIISIDDNYQYALVVGHNTKYLWILSRDKTLPPNIRKKYIAIAETLNFDTEKLVWTIQE